MHETVALCALMTIAAASPTQPPAFLRSCSGRDPLCSLPAPVLRGKQAETVLSSHWIISEGLSALPKSCVRECGGQDSEPHSRTPGGQAGMTGFRRDGTSVMGSLLQEKGQSSLADENGAGKRGYTWGCILKSLSLVFFFLFKWG